MSEKICTSCDITKHIDDFPRHRRVCRVCYNESQRKPKSKSEDKLDMILNKLTTLETSVKRIETHMGLQRKFAYMNINNVD